MFLEDRHFQIILIIITSLVGIFGVSSALQGYLFTNMNVIQRLMAGAAGLLLIDPNLITDVVGVTLIAAVIVWQILEKKASKSTPTPLGA